MIIRTMTMADYSAVTELWKKTEGMSLRDADSKENIEKYLALNPGLSFVAEANEAIIAAVLAGTDGRRGYLQHLSVATAHRGQGLGKKLVNSVVQALASHGVSKTHLFVHSDNDVAQNFYLKSGWVEREEVRMYSFNSSNNSDV